MPYHLHDAGRCFSYGHYHRKLRNGEEHDKNDYFIQKMSTKIFASIVRSSSLALVGVYSKG